MTLNTEQEPLEAGLPDGTEPVVPLADVPTMDVVSIPDDFEPHEDGDPP